MNKKIADIEQKINHKNKDIKDAETEMEKHAEKILNLEAMNEGMKRKGKYKINFRNTVYFCINQFWNFSQRIRPYYFNFKAKYQRK